MVLHEHKAPRIDDLPELRIIKVQLENGFVLTDVVDTVLPLAVAGAVGGDIVAVDVAVDALGNIITKVLQTQRRHLPGDLEGVHHLAHNSFHLSRAGMAAQLSDLLLHEGQAKHFLWYNECIIHTGEAVL